MNRGILTINAGSSSIKFALFPLASPVSPCAEVSGQIDGIGTGETRLVAKDRHGAKDHAGRPRDPRAGQRNRVIAAPD